MKRIISSAIIILIVVAFAINADARRKEKVRVVGGASIPSHGMVIDVSYDPRFDTFLPGYKLVQVAIINNSFNIIPMNPRKDRWTVHAGRRKYAAFADLFNKDKKAWEGLPEKARDIIAYPLLLPIGARQVFDLFVPDKADLTALSQVDVDIAAMPAKFEVIPRK